MATSITYKNNEISSFDSGTKILKTSGKYLEDDITVVSTSSGGAAAISITDEEDTHGGTIRHINAVSLADDTVAPDKLLQGYTAHNSAGEAITGTYVGGSNETPATHEGGVIFIDYDGTVLYEYTAAQFGALQSLPANPTHSGLTAQGWNWTMQEITTQLTAMPEQDVIVGQLYITDDGKTRIYVEVLDSSKDMPMKIQFAASQLNGIEINWGDGTTQLNTATTKTTYSHTYTASGTYCITLECLNDTTLNLQFGTNENILGPANTVNLASARRLQKLELGKNITVIRYLTYSSLCETITMPNYEINLLSQAFQTSNHLKALVLSKQFTGLNNSSLMSSCYLMSVVALPPNITQFNSTFGYCYNLQQVTIPYATTILSGNVFQSCYKLQLSSKLPTGITAIGNSCFYECSLLQEIEISSTVTSIGQSAFRSCINLLKVTINSSNLTIIDQYCYSGCYALKELSIPSSTNITSIAKNAFENCYSLQKIPDFSSVTTIGSNAFQFCYGLSTIKYSSIISSIGDSCFKGTAIRTVNIPSTITAIPSSFASYCKSLSNVTLPNTLKTIGNNSFEYNWQLQHITIPSGATSIGSYAFSNCRNLQSIELPSSLTSIGTYAFQYCSIRSITIPSLITAIPNYCFYQSSLRKPILSNNITSIGASAFYASDLADITFLPESLETIGASAFANNYSFCTAIIPKNVTDMGNSIFYGCQCLQRLYMKPTSPPTLGTSALPSNANLIIYVPYSIDHSVLNAYKTATNWSTYASKMVEEDPT